MSQSYKTKIAHILENGDKLELEAWVDASNYDEALNLAKKRFQEVVTALSTASSISIDKSKIETGAHKKK